MRQSRAEGCGLLSGGRARVWAACAAVCAALLLAPVLRMPWYLAPQSPIRSHPAPEFVCCGLRKRNVAAFVKCARLPLEGGVGCISCAAGLVHVLSVHAGLNLHRLVAHTADTPRAQPNLAPTCTLPCIPQPLVPAQPVRAAGAERPPRRAVLRHCPVLHGCVLLLPFLFFLCTRVSLLLRRHRRSHSCPSNAGR